MKKCVSFACLYLCLLFQSNLAAQINLDVAGEALFQNYGQGTYLNTPAYLLAVDNLGNMIEVDPIAIPINNIYNSNGNLYSTRIADLSGFDFVITNFGDARFWLNPTSRTYQLGEITGDDYLTVDGIANKIIHTTDMVQMSNYGNGNVTGPYNFELGVHGDGEIIEIVPINFAINDQAFTSTKVQQNTKQQSDEIYFQELIIDRASLVSINYACAVSKMETLDGKKINDENLRIAGVKLLIDGKEISQSQSPFYSIGNTAQDLFISVQGNHFIRLEEGVYKIALEGFVMGSGTDVKLSFGSHPEVDKMQIIIH